MAHPQAWNGRISCHAFPAQKIVWVEVPKAASTTVKIALANGLLGGSFHDDFELHDFFGHSSAPHIDGLHEWMTNRWATWWKFTVVRHPIARFISLYNEKIDPHGLGDIDAWVAANADSHWWDDIHAAQQVDIIGDPAWYDHVGRVESLEDTADVLSTMTGVPLSFGRHNASSGRTASVVTRTRLFYRYARDIDALGYEPHSDFFIGPNT